MEKRYNNIVLNIPHSGTGGLPGKWDNPVQLGEEVNRGQIGIPIICSLLKTMLFHR